MYRFAYVGMVVTVLAVTACSTQAMLTIDSGENSAHLELDIQYKEFFQVYLEDLALILGNFLDVENIAAELEADPRFINPQVSEFEDTMHISLDIYPFFETMQDITYITNIDDNPKSLEIFLHSGLIGQFLLEIPSLSIIAQGFILDERASPYALRESLYWALEEYASRDAITQAFDTSTVSLHVNSVGPIYKTENSLVSGEKDALFQFNPFSFENNSKKIAIVFPYR